MSVTVQDCLDTIVSLIARQGEDPSDSEILFYMDAALKELQSEANWPVLQVVREVAVQEDDTTVVLTTNVLKKIVSISYIYNQQRIFMRMRDPSQWPVTADYPEYFAVSSINSVLCNVPFPSDGNIVFSGFEYLPLPAVDESNGLIDVAPQLIVAKTMLMLSPKLRLEAADVAIYERQTRTAINSLNRWTASLVGSA